MWKIIPAKSCMKIGDVAWEMMLILFQVKTKCEAAWLLLLPPVVFFHPSNIKEHLCGLPWHVTQVLTQPSWISNIKLTLWRFPYLWSRLVCCRFCSYTSVSTECRNLSQQCLSAFSVFCHVSPLATLLVYSASLRYQNCIKMCFAQHIE